MAKEFLLGRVVGPQGPQGEQGIQGDRGERGERGEQGAPGQVGAFVEIWPDTDSITEPTEGVIYWVGTKSPFKIYKWIDGQWEYSGSDVTIDVDQFEPAREQVTQAEAEAGVEDTVRGWTAHRVRQAVNAVVDVIKNIFNSHIGATNNPHGVTAAQVGAAPANADGHATRAVTADTLTTARNFTINSDTAAANVAFNGGANTTLGVSVTTAAGVTASTLPPVAASTLQAWLVVARNCLAWLVARFNADGHATRAMTADTLTTARNIGGVPFNGSANINLPGVNVAGNQNTSGTADTANNGVSVNVADTRYVNNTPATLPFPQNRVFFEFKMSNAVGNPPVHAPGLAAFSYIMTYVGWDRTNAAGGGFPVQLSFGNGLALRVATAANTWGAWTPLSAVNANGNVNSVPGATWRATRIGNTVTVHTRFQIPMMQSLAWFTLPVGFRPSVDITSTFHVAVNFMTMPIEVTITPNGNAQGWLENAAGGVINISFTFPVN